jgi:predicted phage terminase large subunit-like protein
MSSWDDFNKNLTQHDAEVYEEKLDILDARESLLDFITFTKKNYIVNWHHKLICDSLDDFLVNPDRNYLIITVGPRRGKSEIVSRRLPAYFLGKFPDKKVISCSYGAELSSDLNRDVQRIIDTDDYRKVFPNTRLSSSNVRTTSKKNYVRTSNRFDVVGHDGTFISAGVDGPITGKGFHLGIIDDPIKNDKEAQSKTRKKAIWKWYDTTFSTREMSNAKTIMILTRWAKDDLAGMLLEQAEKNPDAPQWEVLCFPEVYDEDHPWIHPDDPRENGQVLWPQAFPEKKVKAIMAGKDKKTWNSLFQQLPTPDEGVVFKKEWFRYFKNAELPQIDFKMLSVDCAFKGTDTSDYVALGVWGVTGPNKYLLYYKKERLDFPDTIFEIMRTLKIVPDIRKVLVEDKANGPAVISTLRQKISRLVPFMPKESKEARANAVAPQLQAGNVFLPDPYDAPNRTAYPWCIEGVEDFVEEVCAFPYGTNDDSVDMMTQALLDIGEKTSWVDEFLGKKEAGQNKITKSEKFENELADLMGWSDDTDARYGGIFKKTGY